MIDFGITTVHLVICLGGEQTDVSLRQGDKTHREDKPVIL